MCLVLTFWGLRFADRRDKAIALPADGLKKSRLFGVILKNLADFANGGIDCVVGIEEDVLAPQLFHNFVPADQLSTPLD